MLRFSYTRPILDATRWINLFSFLFMIFFPLLILWASFTILSLSISILIPSFLGFSSDDLIFKYSYSYSQSWFVTMFSLTNFLKYSPPRRLFLRPRSRTYAATEVVVQ